MKVYIAASIKSGKGPQIAKALKESEIDCYNPSELNLCDKNNEDRVDIFNKCLHAIENDCDVLLAVAPYGKSVAGEVAFAGCLKMHGKRKKIILYNSSVYEPCDEEIDAIQGPFFDAIFKNLNDVINYIKRLI